LARVLFVYSRRNTFTRIDLEALRERFEVEEYRQGGALPRVRELIGKLRRCDVVFGWFASWHTLAALNVAALLRKPRVLVIGGFDTASVPEIGYGNQQDPLRKWRSRLTIARADRLITNSFYLAGEIERNLGIPRDRVKVVHHGLADRFGEATRAGDPARVLTVGVVHRWNLERKGHLAFVEAARELPEVEFVLAGSWEDDAIEVLRSRAGPNVTFTGYLSDADLDEQFRAATVYVQASWHEGFGLAVAEAMLAGAIPVVTSAGALPEVVGDTGIVVPSVDAHEVARGVRAALELSPDAGQRARERVLREFPLEARAEGICSEVEAAVAAGAERAAAHAPE
jgi:glycosyltransferase involved in cell wall biosynthesis